MLNTHILYFTLRTHVPREGADYEWASVLLDGKELVRFGDYYHEKGFEKCEGFIEGYTCHMQSLLTLGIKVLTTIEIEEYVDPECYREYDAD